MSWSLLRASLLDSYSNRCAGGMMRDRPVVRVHKQKIQVIFKPGND
jgi:hypothetical protein